MTKGNRKDHAVTNQKNLKSNKTKGWNHLFLKHGELRSGKRRVTKEGQDEDDRDTESSFEGISAVLIQGPAEIASMLLRRFVPFPKQFENCNACFPGAIIVIIAILADHLDEMLQSVFEVLM